MARITVEDCLTKVDNQYDLVLLAKERTAQLNAGVQMLVPEDNDKKTIISLREIGEGKVQVEDLEKSAVLRLRKEPDENQQQVEVEDEENDDFESLYKGQISKSGIAILPSKRTRKIPELKKVIVADDEISTKTEDDFKVAEPSENEEGTKVAEPSENEEGTKVAEPLTLKEEVTD